MLKVNGETMLRWVKVAVEGEVGSRLRKEIEKREEERGGGPSCSPKPCHDERLTARPPAENAVSKLNMHSS